MRFVVSLAGSWLALNLAGCTFLLDRSGEQCSSTSECQARASDTVCVAHVCQLASAVADGGVSGPPGCFSGTPSTDVEFFNQCTSAQYQAFDNCARIGLCGDAAAPALINPPSVDAGTTPDGGLGTPPVGCYDKTTRSKLIFMEGGTNFPLFVKAVAPIVAASGYTVVYRAMSSCAGAGAAGFDTGAGKNLLTNPTNASQPYAAYYDASGNATPCTVGNSPASPDGLSEIVDIGESDTFANNCPLPTGQATWIPGSTDYPDIAHYLGPVQAMLFVTPPPSSQRAISAEAARLVFGAGGAGVTAPWTDPSAMFVRSASTGTNNVLSLAIGIPPSKWWGVDAKTSQAMQTTILTTSAADAEKTIGTITIDYADSVRNSLHILYFQAAGQLAGFLPDSTPFTHDKQNVRDGHYSPWGPTHLYSRKSGGQLSAAASAFILPFIVPNDTLIDATVASGLVPVCAMRVTRDQEMGPLRAFTPDFGCGCYYDVKVSGITSCQACKIASDCPSSRPACNLGYCEVK